LNRRLGGPHCQSGLFGEEENIFPILEIEPRTPHSISWPLYELSYYGFRTVDENVQQLKVEVEVEKIKET
jgi:hypothetical protein